MKARNGALLALLMTVLVVGVLFVSPASADGEYTVNVNINGTNYVESEQSSYTSDSGTCSIVLNINESGDQKGWYFKDGTSVKYSVGAGAEQTYPVSEDCTSITVPVSGITDNCTVTFRPADSLSDCYDITVNVVSGLKCTAEQTVYSVKYNQTQDIVFNVTTGYELTTGQDVLYTIGTTEYSYTIKNGEETSFIIETPAITEDTTLEITSASVVQTHTATIASGHNISGLLPSYPIRPDVGREITMVLDDGYYLTKGTKVHITQGSDDIYYTVPQDMHEFRIISNPTADDCTITIAGLTDSEDNAVFAVRYYAVIENNGYGSSYVGAINTDSDDPTEFTKGSLTITDDASGYILMSVGSGDPLSYNSSIIFTRTGAVTDNTYYVFSGAPALVQVSNGDVVGITVKAGGSLDIMTSDGSLTMSYVNDTLSDMILTYTSGSWAFYLDANAYKAFEKRITVNESSVVNSVFLRFMKDVPTEITSLSNLELHLCTNTGSVSIDLGAYIDVYMGSSISAGMPVDGVLFETLSGTSTIAVNNGYITSASVSSGASICSDSKIYRNVSSSSVVFEFTAGKITGGYDCKLESSFDNSVIYYSTVEGAVQNSRSGDAITLDTSYSGTFDIIQGARIYNSDGTGPICVTSENASITVSSGIVDSVIFTSEGVLDITSIAVSIVNKDSSEVIVHISGVTVTSVDAGGSTVTFSPLADSKSSAGNSFTVVNNMGGSIDLVNSGSNVLVKEASGDFVTRQRGTQITVFSSGANTDTAITTAQSGDIIRVFGKASTTGDRYASMTATGYSMMTLDWSFLKVLPAGVKVYLDGEESSFSTPKYVHITDGEMFIVKYYGADSTTDKNSARWIYYENDILYKCGTSHSSGFNWDTIYYFTETPGTARTYEGGDGTGESLRIMETVKILETHNGNFANAHAFHVGYKAEDSSEPSKRGECLEKAIHENSSFIQDHQYSNCTTLRSVSFTVEADQISSSDIVRIGYYAFDGCTNLTEINCPYVYKVGQYAFRNCVLLKEFITYGNVPYRDVECIDGYAFYGCTALEKVVHTGADGIYSCAFKGCTALIEVSVPNVTRIYGSAFEGCSNLSKIEMDNVQIIGSAAFRYCSNLGDLYLPNVRTIGDSAFRASFSYDGVSRIYNDDGIKAKNIYMPNVENISSTAFGGCKTLETVTVTNLMSLGSYAFHKCTSLKTFYAPNLVTTSGSTYVFEGCTSLTSFYAPKMTQADTYFFCNCENLRTVVLESITFVGTRTFANCTSLEYLYLPEVITISSNVFCYVSSNAKTTFNPIGSCTALKSAYMPKVTAIGYAAFAGCTSLETIYCPNVTTISDYAFFGCTSLKEMNTPELETMAGYSFVNDISLERVNMPKLSEVAEYSFYSCTSLRDVDIGSAIAIGNNVFDGCTGLLTVNMSKCITVEPRAFYNCEKFIDIDLPLAETVKDYAFYNCKAATKANLPKALTLGEYAFAKTSSLTTVNMPSVTAICGYCFSDSGIEHVNIGTDASKYDQTPEKVTPIILGQYAFSMCTNLRDVTMGTASNVIIDTHYNNVDCQYQFNGCSVLEHARIGTITWMPYRMFNDCVELRDCTVDTADTVMFDCFRNAWRMTSLSIGTVNTQIGYSDAYIPTHSLGCSGLVTLTLGDVGTICPNAFSAIKTLETVTIRDVNGIGSYAFSSCTALTQVSAGNVGDIGGYCFRDCTNLSDVSIANATNIGPYCFYECTNLVRFNATADGCINLSNVKLTDMSYYSFYDCTSIKDVILSDQTTCIPQYCFRGCSNLETITAKNVDTLKAGAFGFTNLNSIILNEDESASTYICVYSNFPLWHTAHTVKIGGFVVESGSSLGKEKTLTLTNCTIDAHNYNSNSTMSMSTKSVNSEYDVGFKYVYINANVTVGEQSFASMEPLETIVINENANDVNIGPKAFLSTRNLMDVYINTDVAIADRVFCSCTKLTTVHGGQHIKSIGADAFECCYKLQNIFDGTGDSAYNPEGSTGRVISIPNATYIDDYGLYLCYSKIMVEHYYSSTTYGGLITEVYAPNVTKLGEGAIMASNLSKVTVGALTELHTTSFGHMLESEPDTFVFYPSINLHTFICESYNDTDESETAVDKIRTDMFNPSNTVVNVYINNLGIVGTMDIDDQFRDDSNLQELTVGKIALTVNEGFSGSALQTLIIVGDADFGNSAFRNCTSLTSVTMIGDCRPTFGTSCFDGCTDLQSFTADSTASPVLNADLFSGCTNLSTFTVSGLTALPDRLFNGCSNLEKINSDRDGEVILNSVTSVGTTPFSGMTIKYMQLNGMTHITAAMFTGMTSIVELSINGATQIDDDALEGFADLRILNIDGMDTISKDFINNDDNNNTKLQRISILGALKIQQSAFQGCSNLNTVSLNTTAGDGIITIYANAFKDCSKLTTIDLTCVRCVYSEAFSDSGILDVEMPYANQVYDKAFYNCSKLRSAIIPRCTSFGTSCFSCDYDALTNTTGKKSGLTTIDIADDDRVILGDYMFKSCLNLSKINSTTAGTADLSSAISIGEGTFSGCVGLKTVNIPADVSAIGDYSFDGCTKLKTVEAASGSDITIGNYAFRNCTALLTVNFSNVTSIGDYSFENCSSLYSLSMPNLSNMGKNSFSGCSSLLDVDMSSLTYVTSGAFSGCINLVKVVMTSLKTVSSNAFDGCILLEEFGGKGTGVLDLSKVKSVGDCAFRNCAKFTSINLGAYVTQIGNYSFYGLTHVEEIILPESLKTIGEHAFDAEEHCGAYKTISIPSSIKAIGEYAFGTMNNVDIYLNCNLTDNIGFNQNAFYSYSNITVHIWNDMCDADVSNYVVSGKGADAVTKIGENHMKVIFSSLDETYTKVSTASAVLMNDGYIILPYGMNESGEEITVLYFGMAGSETDAPTLALLNTAGDHSSVAKSGDSFRPIVNYTSKNGSSFYYNGTVQKSSAGGSTHIAASVKDNIPVYRLDFTEGDYWYRDTVTLPTVIDPKYQLISVYGDNAEIYNGIKEQFYIKDVRENSTIDLGYVENRFIASLDTFQTAIIWYDESGEKVTYGSFGNTIGELEDPAAKTGYHFLWWSTVEGSDDEAYSIDENYILREAETKLYAIYEVDTFYIEIDCTSPSEIEGTVSDDPFVMKGVFSFTINSDGTITYTDSEHTSPTVMFDATKWNALYEFSMYAYAGSSVVTAITVDHNSDMGDGDKFSITLVMDTIESQIVWSDASGKRTTYGILGRTIGELEDPAVKTGYHFLWWSTAEGSDEEAYSIDETCLITHTEVYLYAIYDVNTYYLNVTCSSPSEIEGTVSDDPFVMKGVFSFTVSSDGTITYTDSEHTSATVIFDATEWKSGYDFYMYAFNGAIVDTTVTENYDSDMEDGDIFSITLIMKEVEYELCCDFNGNGNYTVKTVKYTDIEKLDHVQKIGYDFIGWSSSDIDTSSAVYSATGEVGSWNTWADTSLKVSDSYFRSLTKESGSSVHLTAVYSVKEYTVEYDSNGGTGTAPSDSATYKINDRFTAKQYGDLIGTNGEKIIVGWSTDRYAAKAMYIASFTDVLALAADDDNEVTLYAVWVDEQCYVKIDLNGMTADHIPSGWTLEEGTGYYVKNVALGTSVKDVMSDWTYVTLSKEGFTFSSWQYSATIANDDVTVKAISTVNEYEVRFWNDGTLYSSYKAEHGSAIILPDSPVKEPTAEYSFVFEHWALHDGTEYSAGNVTQDIDLYAVFTRSSNSYDITFMSEGNVFAKYTLYYGMTITVPDDVPEKEPTLTEVYPFIEWNTKEDGTGDKFTSGTVDGDLTLYAKYESAIRLFDVKYIYGNNVLFDEEYIYGASVTVRDAYSITGYTTSWNVPVTVSDGKFVMPGEDVVITLSIEQRLYHAVFFDEDGKTVLCSYDIYYGEPIPDVATPAKKSTVQYDYSFGGWKDLSGNDAVIPDTIASDLSFKASYSESVRSYYVIYNSDTGEKLSSVLTEYGTVIVPIDGPVKESDGMFTYAFSHWDGYVKGMTVTDRTVFTAYYYKTPIIPETKDMTYKAENDQYVRFTDDNIQKMKEKAETENVTLTVTVEQGTVVFDKDAVLTFNGGNDLTISKMDNSKMSDSVKEIVGDATVYEIYFGTNKDFGNGTATITVPYQLKEGEDPNNLVIYYLMDGRVAQKIDCTYKDGTVTFTTNHFSTYAVVNEPAEENSSDNTAMFIIAGVIGVIAILSIAGFMLKGKKKTEQ